MTACRVLQTESLNVARNVIITYHVLSARGTVLDGLSIVVSLIRGKLCFSIVIINSVINRIIIWFIRPSGHFSNLERLAMMSLSLRISSKHEPMNSFRYVTYVCKLPNGRHTRYVVLEFVKLANKVDEICLRTSFSVDVEFVRQIHVFGSGGLCHVKQTLKTTPVYC